ncbi:MerR family transcriptional regulator [Nocardiopsis tropica]|uniref:MerR family transcriptional regulator n=1 Tax=Nocardiopsis tropica TaxID=109330 RepID=A0ABU7KIZ5_9ACTN|nr:MerR family transcriptional regulator [Nocardiopsis umidischolae]MEE2049261.1 MerR family transcriptional regulator [Nocardiopsis umidischolae]
MKRYPTAPNLYMDPVEAAQILGVATSTLRTWARTGRLEGIVDWFPDPTTGWRYYRAGDIYDLAAQRGTTT